MKAFVRWPVTLLGMLAVYAVLPVPGGEAPPLLSWLVFVAGISTLGWVAVALVRHERQSPGEAGIRIETVVALLYAVLVFFSLVYLGLAARPGQFEDLHNRVDALYFTMATLATVGYGDVHAVGTAARAVVTAQMFFNLTFIAVGARVIGPAIVGRRGQRLPATGEAAERIEPHSE